MIVYHARGRDTDGAKIHQAFASRAEAMKETRKRAALSGHDFALDELDFPKLTKAVLIDLYNDRKPRPYKRTRLATFRPYGPSDKKTDLRRVRVEK